MKHLRRLKQNPYLLAGLIITGILLLGIVISFFWMPYDPTKMDSSARNLSVSLSHLMGTDKFGRDIFSRVLYGSRITLLIAMGTVAIGVVAGIIIGAVCGYFGGMLDEVLMRVIDALFAFPSILLALVFVSLLGPGTWQVVIALGVAFVPSFARIVRAEYLRCRKTDYIRNAKLQGVPVLRILFVHILPNVKGVLLSSVMIGFNNAVLAEASLSFLGIGSQPPYSSLGQILSDAQSYLFLQPTYVICPGVVIILMVLGFSFLGEGISRMRG